MSLIPILKTLGLNSICENGENIIMLDYDNVDIAVLVNEIQYVIDKYMLSDFYVIHSTNGHNAFCLDKIPLEILKNIFKDSIHCDKNFKEMSIKKGYSTIRIGIDKQYKLTITKTIPYNKYTKSKVHRNALIYYYDIPVINNNHYDNSTFCQLCRYENIKYGEIEINDRNYRI
jgi:hypothetical protein